MKKIHVVPHFHWDREWYFTTSRSKVYLLYDLENVLNTLENKHTFKCFVVDGQASLIDDYLAWKPEDKERIRKLVQSKKLIIGPWYTQTDQMVVSAESIVRNLYYGIKRCEEFGGYMNVGYVPDSFGQAGNMPQIYQGFGIKDTLFWRGVSDDMVQHTEYLWEGDDGTEVFAVQMPSGYYIGGNIPSCPKDQEQFWQMACINFLSGRASTHNLYFPNGFDQAPIRTDLPELLLLQQKQDPDNQYIISHPEAYIEDVKKENPTLEKVKGELLIAKHMRIHKSIYSSRSDLKIMNTEIQNYVTHVLEPLLVLSKQAGNPYPKEAISSIWKLLFENAAHDSMGSCVSDSVNEDVFMRYKQAHDIAVNLAELHCRLISTSLKNKEKKITWTLFNTMPIERDEVIVFKTYIPDKDFEILDIERNSIPYTIIDKKDLTEYVLSQTIRLDPSKDIYLPEKVFEATLALSKKDIPSFGYEQLCISFGGSGEQKCEEIEKLQNKYYKIDFNEDGSFNVFDKESGFTYKNQGILVENGDDGDSFNYSPPRQDLFVYSNEYKAKITKTGSKLWQNACVEWTMMVPYDLKQRSKKIKDTALNVKLNLTLRENSRVIDVCVDVDNRALSHRLCIIFNTEIASKFNIADQQFGIVKRPNGYEAEMKLYQKSLGFQKEVNFDPMKPDNWKQEEMSWQEPPIAIEPCQSFVSLSEKARTVGVIPQGVREYEIIGDRKDTICLTLFRTYGHMGKENLLYRPGRASGERIIETPDAQLLKPLTFHLGVAYLSGSFNQTGLENLAKIYNSPVQVYEYAEFLNGRLMFSQMEIEGYQKPKKMLFKTGGKLVVSAVKNAEQRPGIVIRLFNGKDHEEIQDALMFNEKVKVAEILDLKEETTEEIVLKDPYVVPVEKLGHCKFITIYVEF